MKKQYNGDSNRAHTYKLSYGKLPSIDQRFEEFFDFWKLMEQKLY